MYIIINTPKMAMSAEGFTLVLNASFKVLQTDDQKSLNLGQVQNIWAISVGAELQCSHLSWMSEYILDSLDLV